MLEQLTNRNVFVEIFNCGVNVEKYGHLFGRQVWKSFVEGTYFKLPILFHLFITFEPVHPQRFQHLTAFWRPSPSFYYSFNSCWIRFKTRKKKHLAAFAPIELYCFVSGKNLSILDYANRYWTETRSIVKIFTYTMVIHDCRDRWTVPKIYSPMRTSAQMGF